jgi:hypothetical protein
VGSDSLRSLLFAFCLVPAFAYGAQERKSDRNYCHSIEDLRKRVSTCHNNAYYAEAAVLCVKKLKAAVDVATAAAKVALGAQVGQMGQAQKQNFNTTDRGYQLSQAALAALVAQGEQGLREVERYRSDVVFPEDYESPEINTNPVQFLAQSPCYKENQDAISLVRKDFQRKIAELKAAQAAAGYLQNVSAGREAGVGANSTQNAGRFVNRNQGGAAAPRAGGTPKSNRQSDVTGEAEMLRKKQNQRKP